MFKQIGEYMKVWTLVARRRFDLEVEKTIHLFLFHLAFIKTHVAISIKNDIIPAVFVTCHSSSV